MVLTTHKRGFTLLELLIVLAILAALAAIVIPVGTRAGAMARRVQCAANLRSIGDIYFLYMGDHPDDRKALANEAWVPVLMPYVLDQSTPFICPEDDEPDWAWPLVTMRTNWLGGRDEDIFEIYPHWLEGAHNDFEDKPKIWRVNDDVYQAMGKDRRNMPQYTPGSNPKEYWFILEDIGDDDFLDFDVHVKELANGTVEVSGKHWANAHARHHIIGHDGVAHEVIDTVGPLKYSVPPSSYAISSKAYAVIPGMRKIVFLDYESKYCRVLDDLGPDPEWAHLNAPRHLERLNVLFADGSVEFVRPDDINPEIDSDETEALWKPVAN